MIWRESVLQDLKGIFVIWKYFQILAHVIIGQTDVIIGSSQMGMFSYPFVTHKAVYLLYIDYNTIEKVSIYEILLTIFYFSFIYGHASLAKRFHWTTSFVRKIHVCIFTKRHDITQIFLLSPYHTLRYNDSSVNIIFLFIRLSL